jgi:hypothetical protein
MMIPPGLSFNPIICPANARIQAVARTPSGKKMATDKAQTSNGSGFFLCKPAQGLARSVLSSPCNTWSHSVEKRQALVRNT